MDARISLEISEAMRCCWPLSFSPELDTTIFDAIAMGLNPAIIATGAVPGIFLPLSEVSIRKKGWPPPIIGSESAASTAIFLSKTIGSGNNRTKDSTGIAIITTINTISKTSS